MPAHRSRPRLGVGELGGAVCVVDHDQFAVGDCGDQVWRLVENGWSCSPTITVTGQAIAPRRVRSASIVNNSLPKAFNA